MHSALANTFLRRVLYSSIVISTDLVLQRSERKPPPRLGMLDIQLGVYAKSIN
jgi:hypothetical protein